MPQSKRASETINRRVRPRRTLFSFIVMVCMACNKGTNVREDMLLSQRIVTFLLYKDTLLSFCNYLKFESCFLHSVDAINHLYFYSYSEDKKNKFQWKTIFYITSIIQNGSSNDLKKFAGTTQFHQGFLK